METIKNNPVLIAALVPIIVYIATAMGLDMDETTAASIAGGVLVVGGFIARALVRTKRTLPDPDAVKTTIERPPSSGPTLAQ